MMICTADGFLKQVCKFAAASQLPIGYLKKKGSFSISCSCALLKSFWYSDPHPLFLSSFHICVWGGCDPLFPAVENAWKSWGRDGDPATARVKWVMGRERERARHSTGLGVVQLFLALNCFQISYIHRQPRQSPQLSCIFNRFHRA